MSESGRTPELSDAGVPFTYLDNGVRSNIRYFYSVTAFDVNSIQSGPSNIESPRATKSVTPAAPATNFQNQATLTNNIVVPAEEPGGQPDHLKYPLSTRPPASSADRSRRRTEVTSTSPASLPAR